jgi:2-keto-4-pentenoate hydratase/2-oxohepta-3-ene-1,7-dioic acid hydratase in catechol pathway
MSEESAFGVGTFAGADGAEFAGLVINDQVIDLRSALGEQATTLGLLHGWDESFKRLSELARGGDDAPIPLSELRALPPVASPQILCAGANYHRHVRQIVVMSLKLDGDERPPQELEAEAERQLANRIATEPFLFIAAPSAMCGAGDDVVLWGPGRCHDWELELAVVIGRGGVNIDESHAMEHVAGYVISNDISVRDVQHRPNFPMTDFVRSKNRPTYFPTGPYFVPREFIPDPRALRIELSVNGEKMQDELVDMILTGSPAGNAGHHGDRWLRPGDLIEGRITGLGVQRNRCVADPS